MATVGIRRLAIVCSLASGGCYTGLSADVGPALETGGEGGAPGSGGDASPDDDDTGPEQPEAEGLDATRVWRLSASQYERTVAGALGIDVALPRIAWGSRTDDFINYAHASGVDDVFFATLEEDLFALVTENLDTIGARLQCSIDALDGSCLSSFLGPFVVKAHRTDTTPVEPYLDLYANLAPTQGPRDAVASVLVAVLLSPKAFFRTQLGDDGDDVTMTPYEFAEYLAYMVWNGPPDDPLLAAVSADLAAEAEDRMATRTRAMRFMIRRG